MFRTALYRNLGTEAASRDNWRLPANLQRQRIMSEEAQGQRTPIERIEREELKRQQATKDRARARLESYSRSGEAKAIRTATNGKRTSCEPDVRPKNTGCAGQPVRARILKP